MVSYSTFSVIVLGVLATLISAQPYPPQRPAPPTPYQSSASPQKVYSGPYVPPAAPYNQPYAGDSYEYQNGGYKQPYKPSSTYVKSPSTRVSDDDVLDVLIDTNDAEKILIDFAAETLANQDSQQSVPKKQVTQLTLLDLPALEEQNVLENDQLYELEKGMDELEKIIGDLKANLDDLEYLNAENAKDFKDLEIALANEQFNDSNQVRDIASLLAAVQNLKTKLITIATNQFTILNNEIQKVFGLFTSTRDMETSRMCETGVTTLTADDRRNTVLFNTDFGGQVPQIEYGIVGIKTKFVDEDSSKYPPYGKPYDNKYPQNDKQYDPKYSQYGNQYDPKYSQYGKQYDPKYSQYGNQYDPKYSQYGNQYDPKYSQYGKQYDPKYPQYDYSSYSDREQGVLGGLVTALATTESITFQFVEAAFNNAKTVSFDITWEACSIGPGTRLAKY